MRAAFVIAAALVASTSAAPVAAAQFTFDFATTTALFGGPVSGSGVFTTSDVPTTVGGQTALAVTSISGTFNGAAITGPTLATFGNYFITGPTFVDGSGIRFNTTATTNVTLFYDSNARSYRVNAINQGRSSLVAATSAPVAAPVPEPATWAMLIVGFGMLGMGLRSTRRSYGRQIVAHR